MRRLAVHPGATTRWTRYPPSLLGALLCMSCGGDVVAPFQPVTGGAADGLYWALTLDHHAATFSTVAPYDTIRLTATARDGHGTPLAAAGPVTYRSSDPERVQVTSDGQVRALQTGQSILVTAELQIAGVTHVDRVMIDITDDPAPPRLAHLSIHPDPPNSTTLALTGDGTSLFIGGDGSAYSPPVYWFPVTATDTGGKAIANLNIACTVSDPAAALFFCGPGAWAIVPLKPGAGAITMMASVTAYGVTKGDTVAFTVTMPLFGVVKIRPHAVDLAGGTALLAEPADLTVTPGGTVIWVNLSGQPVDIVFDDPTNVVDHGPVSCTNSTTVDSGGIGNIARFGEPQDPKSNLTAENCRSRRFAVAGVYPYHSTLTGARGRVVVSDGLGTP